MFHWFKNKQKVNLEHLPDIEIGPDGRPRPPHFRGLSNPENTTHSQRLLALKWSILWRRDENLTPEDLINALNQRLAGMPKKRREPFSETVGMAMSVIQLSAQHNRMERTKRALPWVELRLGPQECPCAVAVAADKVIRSADEGFSIPLVGCDQTVCKCWQQQLTDNQKTQISS